MGALERGLAAVAPLARASCARASCALASCLLASCALGPDYERPAVTAPAGMPGVAASSTAAATSTSTATSATRFTAERPADRWWEVFGDPVLEGLVADARAHNNSYRAAVLQVQVARAQRAAAYAPIFPSLSANGQYANEKQSINALNLPVPIRRPFVQSDSFQGTLDASYELDLWGRIRRGIESADDLVAASDEDRKTAEITLVGDVVTTYFDLGQAAASLAIAREAVLVRERSIGLIRQRIKAGLASELDLRLAESDLEATRANVPEAERQRATAEHRLALLTGRAPDVAFQGRPPAAFEIPPEVPVGIPSTLLERRPDIRAAEARLAGYNATIGQSKAGYFPTVTLVGRFGYSALDAGDLAQPRSELWSVGPQLSIPIFQGGRTQAAVFLAESQTSQAAATYADVVLRAFAEVADAIVAIAAHAQVRDRQAASVAAQEKAVALAEAQYARGAVNYLNVLDAQRTLLQRRTSLLQAQRDHLGDLVRLEKALGGGWTPAPEEK